MTYAGQDLWRSRRHPRWLHHRNRLPRLGECRRVGQQALVFAGMEARKQVGRSFRSAPSEVCTKSITLIAPCRSWLLVDSKISLPGYVLKAVLIAPACKVTHGSVALG